jgi:CheY-like chemotaxis protein
VNVLVIDDQEFTRELLTAIFGRVGAKVRASSSVREGLRLFHEKHPDVVVCDLAMPEEDGFAFVQAVRSMARPLNGTPIVALTAFGRPEDRKHALASGFDAYLKKPVEPADLAATVLRLAETR